jgi:Tol biopolymer transport system component
VSVDSAGAQSNDTSASPSISADGRYVVFGSGASNLVANDTNSTWDVFVHDMQTGVTTRASVDSAGIEGNGVSYVNYVTAISADGRYVTFESGASNLVPNDTNGVWDIFVHDMQTGVTTRASVDSLGVQASDDISLLPAISGNGRYVVFYSSASTLVANDTNNMTDVFVHDMQTGVTTRASVNNAGVQGDGGSRDVSINDDGRYIVFHSDATNLVANDTNNARDVFVRDMISNTTTRVSVDSAGIEGNKGVNANYGSSTYGGNPSISGDGRYIVFHSDATNLVAGDTNAVSDVFVYDIKTNLQRV